MNTMSREGLTMQSKQSALLQINSAEWDESAGVTPFKFRHGLAGDPRLSHQALVALSDRLPVESVEANTADLPILFPTNDVPDLDYSPGELVDRIIELRRWCALHNVERDPEMARLINECLDPFSQAIGDFQGGMTGREGYIFISPEGARVPTHLDYEHNLFLQIQGRKKMTLGFVGEDLTNATLEDMTGTGYGRLPEVPAKPFEFIVGPGEGVYISPKLAHTIETLDDGLSVSLSLVFQTPWLERGARVYAANHDLRRLGLDPSPYGSSKMADHAKSAAVQVWRRGKGLVVH